MIRIPVKVENFGRIAAQTAKAGGHPGASGKPNGAFTTITPPRPRRFSPARFCAWTPPEICISASARARALRRHSPRRGTDPRGGLSGGDLIRVYVVDVHRSTAAPRSLSPGPIPIWSAVCLSWRSRKLPRPGGGSEHRPGRAPDQDCRPGRPGGHRSRGRLCRPPGGRGRHRQ